MRRLWMVLAMAGVLPATAGALTAGEKCEADKLKAVGKYTFCRMKAEAKAIKTNTAPDYAKCDEKYGDKWAVVEGKAGGTCPVQGPRVAGSGRRGRAARRARLAAPRPEFELARP